MLASAIQQHESVTGTHVSPCPPLLELASLVAQQIKKPSATQETQESPVRSLGWDYPWRREWQPTPVFLPGEYHGQRSLVGYSPQGHKELGMTEWLTYTRACALLKGVSALDLSGMWGLLPQPGIEPGPPALAARSLSHWTAREVPRDWDEAQFRGTPSFASPGPYTWCVMAGMDFPLGTSVSGGDWRWTGKSCVV